MPDNNTANRISKQPDRSIPGRILIHAVAVAGLYLLISFVFGNCYVRLDGDRVAVLQIVYRNYQAPGGWGQSLRRFRDLRSTGDVDILIAGSSHAYRSFDPRIFARHSLRAFNMGSTNQTPLNTYHLLRRFLAGRDPELLILEIYARSLSNEDGLESFFDLATNLPLSPDLIKMAIDTAQPHAVNSLVALQMSRLLKPLERFQQGNIEDETYVSGGYCESHETIGKNQTFPSFGKITLSEIQLKYLEKILRLAKDRGIRAVMVTAPFPEEHQRAIANYRALSRRIEAFARRHDVVYKDFNGLLDLETYKHFKDTHHLNHSGVVKFNQVLLRLLRQRGLLPDHQRREAEGSKKSLEFIQSIEASPAAVFYIRE